jgi:predicted N-acetyltransferase YhbS
VTLSTVSKVVALSHDHGEQPFVTVFGETGYEPNRLNACAVLSRHTQTAHGAVLWLSGVSSVDPTVQERGIGRRLMQDVLDRAAEQKFPGVRLLQAGFNNRSLCLYTMLGFRSREPISILQGKALNAKISGYDVRPATEADADACNRLCRHVHGHDRNGELIDAIRLRTASVVARGDRITGYTSAIAFFGHAVAETNADLMAMIAAAPEFGGPGFLVPTRNYELLSWCLGNRLRLVYQMTLMTIGLYSEPAGVWLPSEIY